MYKKRNKQRQDMFKCLLEAPKFLLYLFAYFLQILKLMLQKQIHLHYYDLDKP